MFRPAGADVLRKSSNPLFKKENIMKRLQKHRRIALVEALEGRALLSSGPLILNGTDGPDKIEVYYTQLAQGNFTYNYNVNGVGGSFFDAVPSKIVVNA